MIEAHSLDLIFPFFTRLIWVLYFLVLPVLILNAEDEYQRSWEGEALLVEEDRAMQQGLLEEAASSPSRATRQRELVLEPDLSVLPLGARSAQRETSEGD
jgi:hypothetical protein